MWTAAILAGGRASRFGGRDKSALLVEGRTILDRQMTALATITADVLIITSDRSVVPPPGARAIPDRLPECGPLGGLYTALAEAQGDAVFVVACDMPYVTAPLARFLLERTCAADLVMPQTERGPHPLCAAYGRACLRPVTRSLAEGRLTMTDLIGEVRTQIVTAEEIRLFGPVERLLANVNTPADYAALETLQGYEL